MSISRASFSLRFFFLSLLFADFERGWSGFSVGAVFDDDVGVIDGVGTETGVGVDDGVGTDAVGGKGAVVFNCLEESNKMLAASCALILIFFSFLLWSPLFF